ncbi:MAG: DUF362 domain-containing protein [Anaerolineae bacterium]|nr:DUF362 domain-containing protein [Anaerolineae bacterium]
MPKRKPSQISRRQFLKYTAAGSMLAMSSAAGLRTLAEGSSSVNGPASKVILHSYDREATLPTQAVREAMLNATDLSWLKPGDSVFVKLASNSNLPAPSVTSPDVVEGVVRVLKDAGAGTVYVGDMSGAQFVQHLADETIGSTRENMRQNGLLAAAEAAGAEIHCFEEVPFAEAYVPGIPQIEHHWGDELQVAEILDRVDHIVNLPRLGKHVLAGATLGMKNAVGWISDHSRMVLHRDGATFQEKIVELNTIPQLADKMRLTLTLVDQALTTYGPDSGYHLPLTQPMILASEDVVSHDQVALLSLLWARTKTPQSALATDPYPAESNGLNWWFVRVYWGEEAAAGYQTLQAYDSLLTPDVPIHINLAWDSLRGGRPEAIEVISSGLPVDESLATSLIDNTNFGIQLSEVTT